jgi:hypothetical protein
MGFVYLAIGIRSFPGAQMWDRRLGFAMGWKMPISYSVRELRQILAKQSQIEEVAISA